MSKRKNSFHVDGSKTGSGSFIALSPLLGTTAGVTLIVVAAIFAYFPSISGGFILDDDLLLTKNELIKSPEGLYRIWRTTAALDYWPMSNTTLWIEWRLWGMNPTGYHVTNLVLHIIEALLIWNILRKLSIPGAFLAGMIFAVHPINVESAAWVAQRKDMFAMLFFLLSILWYLNEEREYLPSPDRLCQTAAGRWYWLSLAAFVLAMLGKGSVAVLPVLLLEIVWWRRKISQWDLAKTAPFFLVAVVLAAVNMWFQTHGMEKVYRIASFSERLLGAGDVVWFYLYKDLLPFDLTFVYPQWHIQTYNPLWWLPLAAAVAVTLVLWRYRKRWSRPFLFAWGFFCVALVPVMGFTDVGFMTYSLVADHYQHIALIGVIALAAAGWNVWNQKARGKVCLAAMVLAIAAVGALTFLTWRQSRLYGNPIILYQDTLEKNPNSWLIHNNLGLVLAEEGRPQEAVRHYEKALELNPDYPKIHNNLGKTLLDLGRVQDAIPHLIRAVKLKPDYSTAYNNLGVALGDAGRPQEAIGYFEKAINLNPNYAEAHSNLSVVLAKVGRYSEAIDHCQQAIRIIPDLAGIYCNLASIYAAMHRPSESIAAAQKALELARIHGQKALARQIESQLNPYRASFSDHPNTSAPSKSAPPSL